MVGYGSALKGNYNMKRILSNKRGEGHIDIGIKIIIAVAIGALILGGVYLLFSNVILPQMNNKVEDLVNMGGEIQVRQNNGKLEYSYDGESWKPSQVAGLASDAQVKYFVVLENGDTTVWLVSCLSSDGARLYTSTDGLHWTPGYSDTKSLYLAKSGKGAYISCGDGRAYSTNDGINWTMTSTKRY